MAPFEEASSFGFGSTADASPDFGAHPGPNAMQARQKEIQARFMARSVHHGSVPLMNFVSNLAGDCLLRT